jgi:Ser/Thr protein kinase RdoA (MazF antagonist)
VAADQLTPEPMAPVREVDESLAAKADRLRPELVARLDALPRQLLHGDPHDGNLLLAEGHVTGFIDIDHLPVSPRIGDLGRYLANRMLTPIVAPDEQLPHLRTAGRRTARRLRRGQPADDGRTGRHVPGDPAARPLQRDLVLLPWRPHQLLRHRLGVYGPPARRPLSPT